MADDIDNLDEQDQTQPGQGGAAAQDTPPIFPLKRSLVPLNEYAARKGIPADLVEQQGEIGAVQIRKYKGQKYVVDVPDAPSSADEADEKPVAAVRPPQRVLFSGPAVFVIIALVAVLAAVVWLYLDSESRFNRLNSELIAVQADYEKLSKAGLEAGRLQNELAVSRAELERIQNQIVVSRSEFEKIQNDLAKARRNLETIQSDLSSVQGQLSLSRTEIEGIQNDLNANKQILDNLSTQNSRLTGSPRFGEAGK